MSNRKHKQDSFLIRLKRLSKERYISAMDLKEMGEGGNIRLERKRRRLNRKFIRREQKKDYKIEKNRLDREQIEAVVVCEDAALFLAPAGSGKSASLLAKVNYLIEKLAIPPERILIIAFTNKVVTELKERVKFREVEIRTFHSLGNKILKNKMKGYRLVPEGSVEAFFEKRMKDGELLELMVTVFNLQKSEQVSLGELENRIKKIRDEKERGEALAFLKFYVPIYKEYLDYLAERKLYDFSDMLNRATEIVEKMPNSSFPYQYILVDEAQDLSTSKHRLLKAVLDKCEKVKLFAVGDDWQSIYRFAGSNLRVLNDFEKIFQRETYRGMIQLTYRFGQPTAKISNRFIRKNPFQSKKKVKPKIRKRTPIEVRLNNGLEREAPADYETVDRLLKELYLKYGDKLLEKRIQIISRYNRDIYRIVKEKAGAYKNAKIALDEDGVKVKWRVQGRELEIPFCSMHKAKGITRDIIFVINMNSGKFGMPARRLENPVVKILLAKLDDYHFAEERRLFYVAITRARERTILISDQFQVSEFVFEACPKLNGSRAKVCPKCRRGILVEKRRRKTQKIYYQCSNFSGGCRYTEK